MRPNLDRLLLASLTSEDAEAELDKALADEQKRYKVKTVKWCNPQRVDRR